MPTSRRHILLLEDHRDVRAAFVALFGSVHNYAVDLANSAREAHALARRHNVDIAVVDLGRGSELCVRLTLIREWRSDGLGFPIVVTSASDSDGITERSLEAGADDFLRKPYQFGELRARIQRRLERHLTARSTVTRVDGVILPSEPFQFAGATITPDLQIKFPSGHAFRLTAKQMGILHEFSAHAGALVLKNQLIYSVWGADANPNSSSVHQYLHVLRRLYRDGGLDLDAFVTPESKAGWRIAETSAPEISAAITP